MNHKSMTIKSNDGTPFFVNQWEPSEEVRAVVQISHGMCEHSDRYADFANYLAQHGYGVYANDHRGHGKTAGTVENLGYFADDNGWEKVVDDMFELTKRIQLDYPDYPIYLLGHSMGSFLSRRYIQKYGEHLSGVILSGTSGGLGGLAPVATFLSKYEMRRLGKKGRSKLLNNLGTGSYNKHFQPLRTESDWLSRDEVIVDRFVEDPFCGSEVTTSFYNDMFQGMRKMTDMNLIQHVPKTLPIYLFSGTKDPVGNFTKGVKATAEQFKKAGVKEVNVKFYEDGRHEMLNEINRDEVYHDVLTWLDAHLDIKNKENQQRSS